MKHKATKIAEDRCKKDRQDPLNTEDTPVKIFARRYNLKPRSGLDDKLRDFPDASNQLLVARLRISLAEPFARIQRTLR